MNWLNLLTLILQAAVADLPQIRQIVDGVESATASHVAVLNVTVAKAIGK